MGGSSLPSARGQVSTPETADETVMLARSSVSVAERLEYANHPWSSFVIVPLFAYGHLRGELRIVPPEPAEVEQGHERAGVRLLGAQAVAVAEDDDPFVALLGGQLVQRLRR